jgi:tetratricopeptide (TPR) repeat protein
VTLLFGLLVVLFHSMVDLTMFVWPTNILGLLILGVLLGRIPHGRSPVVPAKIKIIAGAVAVFILVFAGFMLVSEFKSTAACRNGKVYLDMNRPQEAYVSFVRSFRIRPNVESAYRLARISFYDFKQPELALKYLGLLPRLGADNYLHYNEMVGKICFMKRDYERARMFFVREVKNYPLSVRGWYYLMLTEQQLNDEQGVLKTRETLDLVLKQKNLTPEFIPLLLTNEYWDLNPRKIPRDVLGKYNLKRP